MEDDVKVYLKESEKQVNILLSKVLLMTNVVFPVLWISKITGIFSYVDTSFIYYSFLIFVFLSVHNYLFVKKHPLEKINRYTIVFISQVLIFIVSINSGLYVYITYVSAVLMSCLYFDVLFTVSVSFISFSFMVLSMYIRSLTMIEEYISKSTRLEWFLSVSVSATLEFVIYAIFCCVLSSVIRKTIVSIYQNKKNVKETQDILVLGFANMIEAKDQLTGEHIRRTSEYVRLICRKMMLKNIYPEAVNEHTSDLMIKAAPFHDLGKIRIPDKVLNKKGGLSLEEYSMIRDHPIDGSEFILKNLANLENKELVKYANDMALCHHEHMDGTGYPKGLKGDEIPVSARIMAVADILDALLSERPYKPAFTIEHAFNILRDMAGVELDMQIVFCILSSAYEVRIIRDGGIINYD